MISFAYGSPEQMAPELLADSRPLWEDVPELRVWGEAPEFALRIATHELGRVATIGACFTSESAYAKAVAEALEQDNPEALTVFPGHYTTVLIRHENNMVLKDVAGVSPVYYGTTEDGVTVSSLPSVVAGGRLKVKPDHVAAHIALPTWRGSISGNETCFDGVSRLTGGQALTITDRGIAVSTYEPLNPDPTLSFEEGASRLRSALRDSVGARMHSGTKVRANLSGGKDSSSIVAMALEEMGPDDELPVYFMDDPDLPGGDRDYVEAYLNVEPRLRLTRINSHETEIAPDPEAIKQPEDIALAVPPHRFQVVRDIYGPSMQHGAGLHFSGNGGDEVMGVGSSHLPDLVREGRLLRVLKESITRAKIRNVSPVDIWKDVVTAAFLGTRGSLRKAVKDLNGDTNLKPFTVGYESIHPVRISEVSSSFLTGTARHALSDLLKSRIASTSDAKDPTLGQYLARERAHASGSGQAIESFCIGQDSQLYVESPLLDNEVVRAALAVDVRKKGDPHTFKPILHQAMQGILPDVILNRSTKGIYDPHNARLHTQSMSALADLMVDSRLARMGIIDAEKVCSVLPLLASLPMSTVWSLEQVMTAELWLRGLERAGLTEIEPAYANRVEAGADRQNPEETPPRAFEGTFIVPDYVHAVVSPNGTLTLFNRKTNVYSPLSSVQSHMLRAFAAHGSVAAVVDSLAERYTQADRKQLAADTHRILGEFAALHILQQVEQFVPCDLPTTAGSPRFVSSESKVSQTLEDERASRGHRLLAAAALTGAIALKTFAPAKRLEILKRLQNRRNTNQASQVEAQGILKAVQGIRYLGRLACLESSYAAALALAIKGRSVDWHMGVSFYPTGYHSWIEAEGRPVRTSTEGDVSGDFQSFFVSQDASS